MQDKKPNGESVIILDFELTEAELNDFRQEIKSRLTGTLPLRIALGPEEVTVVVYKKGRGSKTLSIKTHKISSFVSRRLEFEHIQAVRTASSARQVVSSLVERELGRIEHEEEYEEALEKITQIQKPILEELSHKIKNTLVKFLPQVKDVQIHISKEERYSALRSACKIIVDDGSPALLEYKGDGMQSLAALGIMRHASDRATAGKNLVIAIEEPESHLHPTAIHEIHDVLQELSRKHQIVITTHNPLFIDRMSVKSNIIVSQKKARPANTIEEIREILGVRASDNLRYAELVLIVEGEEDRTSVEALLRHRSKKIDEAFKNNTLAIDTLGGANNLVYKVGLIRNSLCLYHCFLDDDNASRKAFEKAKYNGLLTDADVNFSTCEGMQEAEFEDLLNQDIYKEVLINKYRVTLDCPQFHSSDKWSVRMRNVFKSHGKQWNDKIKAEIKNFISQIVKLKPESSLNTQKKVSFDALAKAIDQRLSEIKNHKKKQYI